MNYQTYSAVRQKIQRDLDIQDELFIQSDELMGYVNDAIDECEAEIMTIYEDYFLTSASLSLVQGQSDYSLPSDIYANKIRSIIYANGTTIFPITRVRDWKKFEKIALLNQYPNTVEYNYLIKNPSAQDGMKLVLIPAARETNSTAVTIWYLRNANRVTSDSSIIDIPEFVSFVIAHAKVSCLQKEGHPNLPIAIQNLEKQRQLMSETLTEMVPDQDNMIELDTTRYEEML
jgi:hypothetical protein